jgi:hypothetical protein
VNMTLKDYLKAAVETVQDPQAGARRVMAVTMNRAERWQTLALILVISIILAESTLLLSGDMGEGFLGGPAFDNPLILATMQLFFLFVLIQALHFFGRKFAGTGNLDDAILLVTWLQFIMICVQIVQTVTLFLLPAVGALIGLASIVLFFWLLTNFVAELHGFQSRGNVFAAILLSLFGFAILMSITLSTLGFQIAG